MKKLSKMSPQEQIIIRLRKELYYFTDTCQMCLKQEYQPFPQKAGILKMTKAVEGKHPPSGG
jgi:hypothetical protein